MPTSIVKMMIMVTKEQLDDVRNRMAADLAAHDERMETYMRDFDRTLATVRSESSSCDIQQTRQLPAV